GHAVRGRGRGDRDHHAGEQPERPGSQALVLRSSALASSALGRRDNGRSSRLRANESGHGGVPPSARAGCRGYGSTVSQYHITVQVLDTEFFSLPSDLPVTLAGAVPVVAQAVTVARPAAGLAGAGAPR